MPNVSQTALSAEIMGSYRQANNTLIQQSAPDPVNGVLVEIGDSKQPDFKLQAKFSRWGNEVNFSARLDTAELDAWDTSSGKLVTDGNKVIWRKAKYSVVWYDLGFGDDGGFEHQVIFHGKPPFGRLRWTLRTKGLAFYPQGSLTPEEIAEGCSRPDDIVDSIAVYAVGKAHHRVGGKNYRCGKVKHLKRITLIDASGQKSYGTQAITIANDAGDGEWRVSWDKAWMDAASGDVVVDPTIGYATHGGSTLSQGPNSVAIVSIANQYTASSGDTLSGFTAWTAAQLTGAYATMAAYACASNLPGALVGTPTDISSVTTTLAEYSTTGLSQALTAGTAYCVALTASHGSASITVYWDSGSAPGRYNTTSKTLDDPCPYTSTDNGRHYSWWATVEAGGGATGVTVDLSGLAATGDIGAISAAGGALILPDGLSASGKMGSLHVTGAAQIALSGRSATGQVGTLAIQAGNGVTVALDGISGSGGIGDLAVIGGAHFSLAHIEAQALIGSLSATGSAALMLQSLSGTGHTGELAAKVRAIIALSGLSAQGKIGVLDITGGAAVALSGQLAQGQIGQITIQTGVVELKLPGYRICTVEFEDRRFLVLAEDRRSLN